MSQVKHLSSPPIIEALLDIRVVPNENTNITTLSALHSRVAPGYSQHQTKRRNAFELHLDTKLGNGGAIKTTNEDLGFSYKSQDGTKVFQVTADTFTQNFLRPYSNYETLIQHAKQNWENYVAVAKPKRVTRVALRYINEFYLPLQMSDFLDYLPASPNVPAELPQQLNDFFTRVTLHNNSIDAKAIVIQVFQGEVSEKGVRVVLDIDTFIERQINVDANEIWQNFSNLRVFKNKIFFEYVTDKLLEAYQ